MTCAPEGAPEGEAGDGLALVASDRAAADLAPSDLAAVDLVQRHLLAPLGLVATEVSPEAENAGYDAVTCRVGALTLRLRSGRVTPTKVGLFVSHWRRAPGGSTEPVDATGAADLLLVTAVEGEQSAVFLFPREVLLEHGILRSAAAPGKRGFRVYPPWSLTTSAQARRTQAWQVRHAVVLAPGTADLARARAVLTGRR